MKPVDLSTLHDVHFIADGKLPAVAEAGTGSFLAEDDIIRLNTHNRVLEMAGETQ